MTGFKGWLKWNYCNPIEEGVYARYTNNYGRSDIVASGDYYNPYVKNNWEGEPGEKLTGAVIVHKSDTICDEATGDKLALKTIVLCDNNKHGILTESDFTTTYADCKYIVTTSHAAGCPIYRPPV